MALAEHNWFFARKTMNLGLSGDGVYDGVWTYKYSLPTDLLMAREIHPQGYDDPQPFDVETTDTGNILVTNMVQARIVYTYKCEDEQRYSMTFVNAVAWLLASYLAGPVIQKNKVTSDDALRKYEYFLAKARKESNVMSRATDTESYKNARPDYLPQVS